LGGEMLLNKSKRMLVWVVSQMSCDGEEEVGEGWVGGGWGGRE